MCLDVFGHVVVVVAFITEGTEEVQHFGTCVFALFAKTVFKVPRKGFEKVHVRTHHHWRDGFETEKRRGWRIARFELEVVGDITKEAESFGWGPEKGMDHYRCCVGTGIDKELVWNLSQA